MHSRANTASANSGCDSAASKYSAPSTSNTVAATTAAATVLALRPSSPTSFGRLAHSPDPRVTGSLSDISSSMPDFAMARVTAKCRHLPWPLGQHHKSSGTGASIFSSRSFRKLPIGKWPRCVLWSLEFECSSASSVRAAAPFGFTSRDDPSRKLGSTKRENALSTGAAAAPWSTSGTACARSASSSSAETPGSSPTSGC